MPEKLSSLDDIDAHASSDAVVPPIAVSRRAHRLPLELMLQDRGTPTQGFDTGRIEEDLCHEEVTQTWRSIRAGGKPRTILHSLILRDYLSVPRLAAITRQDVPEVAMRADILTRRNVIAFVEDQDGMRLYYLPGLSTDTT